jgi:hypothetical protein
MQELIDCIYQSLLPNLQMESREPHHPVVVHQVPAPWQLLGAGNYAAVFCHPSAPALVVKVYAPGRPGFREEVEAYRRLGSHPAFSECFYADQGFLILKRLYGVTLYDCLPRGLRIPPQVIQDIEQALNDARSRGLRPHDVHGRNLMMQDGRGLVVDISDFLKPGTCSTWEDLKQAYYWVYRPLIAPLRLRIPYCLLDGVRGVYRLLRRMARRRGQSTATP